MVLGLSILGNLVVFLFCAVAVSLILIVLLQKGRGGGLSSAFGGGGAGSLLGTKTGDVLTWVTISLVALFLVMGVLMGKFMRPKSSSDLSTIPVSNVTTEQPAAAEEGAATVEETTEEAAKEAVEITEEATEGATETPEMPAEDAGQM